MAEQALEIDTPSGADFADRQRTYRIFLAILRYSTAAVIAVLVLMAIFLL